MLAGTLHFQIERCLLHSSLLCILSPCFPFRTSRTIAHQNSKPNQYSFFEDIRHYSIFYRTATLRSMRLNQHPCQDFSASFGDQRGFIGAALCLKLTSIHLFEFGLHTCAPIDEPMKQKDICHFFFSESFPLRAATITKKVDRTHYIESNSQPQQRKAVISFRVDGFDRTFMNGQGRLERVRAIELINEDVGAFRPHFPGRPLPTPGDETRTKDLIFYAQWTKGEPRRHYKPRHVAAYG